MYRIVRIYAYDRFYVRRLGHLAKFSGLLEEVNDFEFRSLNFCRLSYVPVCSENTSNG